MFKNLFRRKAIKNSISKDSLILTGIAHSLAVSSFDTLCEKYPELINVYALELMNKYDIVVKCAGVGIALMRLSKYYDMEKSTAYTKSIMSNLTNDENKLIADFGQYLQEITDDELVNDVDDFPFHVGEWVFAHLAENSNNDNKIEILAEKRGLKSDLGNYLTNALLEFWTHRV